MFAVLHIVDFALHAVLRTEPGTAGRPAALFTGSGKKSLVTALTASAHHSGVELGMTASQALARCPTLLIRAPRPTAETEARAALQAAAFALSPTIEDTAPGLCTVDLRGVTPALTIPRARHALGELTRFGLPATVGLARTPTLAFYAAQHLSLSSLSFSSAPGAPPAKNQSPEKEAGERSPILILTADREKKFLATLPLSVADPSPELAAILADWGLRTLGDLTALPRDDLVQRFGAAGLALWQRASGGEPRPLRPVSPSPHFAATLDLEEAIETLEPLLFLLRRFLDRLTLELRTARFVAAELSLTLRLEDDTRYTRDFRLPEPSADPETLFRALHTHLESLHTAAPIRAVDLRLVPTRPLVRQQGIFETGLRDPHGFAETLARVVALVGSDRVGTPHSIDTHRPDTVRLTPPAPVIPPPAPSPVHAPLGPPLRRFRPPLPAQVEFTAGRPTYLHAGPIRGEIARHGPAYRHSGDWWQHDRAWAHTEWDVALAGGGLYRLLLVNDAWFLAGEYD